MKVAACTALLLPAPWSVAAQDDAENRGLRTALWLLLRDRSPSSVAIEIAQEPSAARGDPTSAARATLRWSVTFSEALERPEISYRIMADSDAVSIAPATGTIGLGEVVETDLSAHCMEQGRIDVRIRVDVDGAEETVTWRVRCGAGNAAVTQLELYQGPLAWVWDAATASRRSYVSAIEGRHALLFVRTTHQSSTVPAMTLKVLDTRGTVAAEILQIRPANTINRGQAAWETSLTFGVPGHLYGFGYALAVEVDPGNALDESDETDNRVVVDTLGVGVPPFRIRFIPIHSEHGEPASIDPKEYMRYIYELFPIADDYRATVAATHFFNGVSWSTREAAMELLHLWYAGPWWRGEFYHGLFAYPRDGSSCGFAFVRTPVALSAARTFHCRSNIYPHEIGHNFGLGHAPGGCGARNPDPRYPYPRAAIGPRRGWSFRSGRFINPADGYFDTMSYCSPNFISDYHYQKAVRARVNSAPPGSQPVSQSTEAEVGEATGEGASDAREGFRSLVLTGRETNGAWTLRKVSVSGMLPRSPSAAGGFSLVLTDEAGHVLHGAPLRLHTGTDGGVAWGARIPLSDAAHGIIIRDRNGNVVLEESLGFDHEATTGMAVQGPGTALQTEASERD